LNLVLLQSWKSDEIDRDTHYNTDDCDAYDGVAHKKPS